MADKLDKLFSDYFTGRLAADIKLRQLPFSLEQLHDGNDPRLDESIRNQLIIDNLLSITKPKVVRVLKARYSVGTLWDDIAIDEQLNLRTLTRYRDEFKQRFNEVMAQEMPVQLSDYFNGKLDVYIKIAKAQQADDKLQQLDQMKATIETLLRTLSSTQLKALTMHEKDSQSWQTISKRLGVTDSSLVEMRRKLIKQWRKELAEYGG